MRYFATSGPEVGPFLWRDTLGAAIGVLEARNKPSPIGMASLVARDEDGVALWKLTVRGVVVPGRWTVVGREFRPAPGDGRGGEDPRESDPHRLHGGAG
jgi:hypothetical protein